MRTRSPRTARIAGLAAAAMLALLAAAPVAAAEGDAHVRVLHGSPDAPSVQDGSATVVDNVAYPNATGYLTLDPGSYDLKVCADADNTVCPLDPGALDLAAGRPYSVFAIGSLAGDTLTAAVGVDGVAAPATDTQATTQDAASSSGLPLAMLALVGIAAFAGSLRLSALRTRR